MSVQKLINSILAIDTKTSKKDLILQIHDIKIIAEDKRKSISSSNNMQYKKDIELSRTKRKRNNSRQAIKKAWKNRKEKSSLIKKHISILRNINID